VSPKNRWNWASKAFNWLKWFRDELVLGKSEPFASIINPIVKQVEECIRACPEANKWRLVIFVPKELTDGDLVLLKSAVLARLHDIAPRVDFEPVVNRIRDPEIVVLPLPALLGGVEDEFSGGVAPHSPIDRVMDYSHKPIRRLANQ
jgi:hypothetical protein